MHARIPELVAPFLANHPQGLIVVLGPTASGKTGVSVELAHWLKAQKGLTAEIISVDSRQVYRGCDISSAKITPEEQQGIVHHGIDLIDLQDEFSVFDWKTYCINTIKVIQARGHVPILAGGTMLWLDAVTQNYDFDEKGTKSDRKNEPLWPCLQIGLQWPREVLYERINARAAIQFKSGLIEETEVILAADPPASRVVYTSFGYQEIAAYLRGECTLDEALAVNQKRNRNYAKRQLTWWRGREEVEWIDMTS